MSNRVIGFLLIVFGSVLILEGMEITSLGEPADDVPYWIVSLAGAAILFCGVAALITNIQSKWKDLVAFVVTALMGTIGGWISLYGRE